MPSFSPRSKDTLATCHPDLQALFHKVIERVDCTILEGHRSRERQRELYDQGKSQRDGTTTRSHHQATPSRAVDVGFWPLDWEDLEAWKRFGAYVKGVADGMGIDVNWGGDWRSFKDYPHWELPDE